MKVGKAFLVSVVVSMVTLSIVGMGHDRGAIELAERSHGKRAVGSSHGRQAPKLDLSMIAAPVDSDTSSWSTSSVNSVTKGGATNARHISDRASLSSIAIPGLEDNLKQLQDKGDILSLISDDLIAKLGLSREVIEETCALAKEIDPDEYQKLFDMLAIDKVRAMHGKQEQDMESELMVALFKLVYKKMDYGHGSLQENLQAVQDSLFGVQGDLTAAEKKAKNAARQRNVATATTILLGLIAGSFQYFTTTSQAFQGCECPPFFVNMTANSAELLQQCADYFTSICS